MYMHYFSNHYLLHLTRYNKKIINKNKILKLTKSYVIFNDSYSIKYSEKNPIIILCDKIMKSTNDIIYLNSFFDLKYFNPSLLIVSDHNTNDYNIIAFISLIKKYMAKKSILIVPFRLTHFDEYIKDNNIELYTFDEKYKYPITNIDVNSFSCLYFL